MRVDMPRLCGSFSADVKGVFSATAQEFLAGNFPRMANSFRDRLRKAVDESGKTPRAISILAGMSPDAIRGILRHPHASVMLTTVQKLATRPLRAGFVLTVQQDGDAAQVFQVSESWKAVTAGWRASGAPTSHQVFTPVPS